MRVAVIPARGGSTRVPRKNVRLFHGKPIIAYSIEVAKASGLFDFVLVSSDDEEIGAVARKYGANWLIRPPELAVDDVGTQEVTRYALKDWSACEWACCIYATCPMLTVEDLKRGYRMLTEGPFEYVYTHGQFYWGRASAFIKGVPLTMGFEIYAEPRHIDINTEADWLRAERMYAELHKVTA